MTYHLKRPHSPDPNLQPAFHTLDIVELDALPPAPSSRLSPEQQQLLCHANGVTVGGLAADVCAKTSERYRADDCFVGLCCTMTPRVCAVETTGGF